MYLVLLQQFPSGNEVFSGLPNLRVKCDKHPADCCVIFDGSEVVSVFNFVVGTCALSG